MQHSVNKMDTGFQSNTNFIKGIRLYVYKLYIYRYISV
jgi:hypothetical protein